MAVELTALPFSTDALEPHISKKTIEYHYGKHHKGYVDKLNQLIQGTAFENFETEDLVEIIRESKQSGQTAIFNNASQAWNHTFYWNCLAPRSEKGTLSKDVTSLLTKHFGSAEQFREQFGTAAKTLFGSGWAWLVKDAGGNLKIRPLPNAENPLIEKETPILTCDVWEHAYYLDYQNERPKYVQNFWDLINWRFVEENLASNGRSSDAPLERSF